ncbi:MAG TPA: hypothetical protein VIW80_18190 [Pyrinomonadaceae bacterium]|jgi:hypothetical protein
MRYLRQFCAVSMLVCALAFSAYAGDIECPGITASSSSVGNFDVGDSNVPTGNIMAKVLSLMLAFV